MEGVIAVAVKELKKKVFVANEVPEECVKNAQVAIVSELSWHIIAPNPYRAHGLGSAMPLPKLTCPVVDVRGVKNDEAMMQIMDTCVDQSAGVINLSGLLTGLEALGAVIQRVNQKVELTSEYWDCECEKDYIHPYYEASCFKCGARREDQPNSRVNEVTAAGLPSKPVKPDAVAVNAAWREKKEGRVARRVQAHRKVKVH